MSANKLNIEKKRNADILETHSYVNARSARSNFSRLVNTARIDKERVIITEHGEPAAAIVPIKDVRLLDKIPNLDWIDNISDAEFNELDRSKIKSLLRGGEGDGDSS